MLLSDFDPPRFWSDFTNAAKAGKVAPEAKTDRRFAEKVCRQLHRQFYNPTETEAESIVFQKSPAGAKNAAVSFVTFKEPI